MSTDKTILFFQKNNILTSLAQWTFWYVFANQSYPKQIPTCTLSFWCKINEQCRTEFEAFRSYIVCIILICLKFTQMPDMFKNLGVVWEVQKDLAFCKKNSNLVRCFVCSVINFSYRIIVCKFLALPDTLYYGFHSWAVEKNHLNVE